MKLELCAAEHSAIRLAQKHRVDRIELCANLNVGGTTPSHGMVSLALNQNLETHVLIRPRAGGFCYRDDEKEQILAEIHALKALNITGFVVGALDQSMKIDETLMTDIRKMVAKRVLTFHRAFDEMGDWRGGVEVLRRLAFVRVLTSGRAANVDAGINNYAEIKNAFGGGLELMIGGGVDADNIRPLASKVLPDAIHFSATVKTPAENSRFAVARSQICETKLTQILNSIKPHRIDVQDGSQS